MQFTRYCLLTFLLAITLITAVVPSRAQSPSLTTRDNILASFQSIFITTHTQFFQPEALQRELYKQKDFLTWDLVMVDDANKADVVIVVDRPALTFDYTFKMVDQKTSIVLGAGKIVAFDGVRAAPGMAKQIVSRIKAVRPLAKPAVQREVPTLIRKDQNLN